MFLLKTISHFMPILKLDTQKLIALILNKIDLFISKNLKKINSIASNKCNFQYAI